MKRVEDDSLKGAVALLRFDNTQNDRQAYVLCYATAKPGRFYGISQAGSWTNDPPSDLRQTPRPVPVGVVATMDPWAFEHSTAVDPAEFAHSLVGLDDLPEHERAGLLALGMRQNHRGDKG